MTNVIIGIVVALLLVALFMITACKRPDDGTILYLNDNEKDDVEKKLEAARKELLEKEAKDVNLNGEDNNISNTAADEQTKQPDEVQDIEIHNDVETADKLLIKAALETFDGNKTLAANRLGISIRTLNRKIKKYNL